MTLLVDGAVTWPAPTGRFRWRTVGAKDAAPSTENGLKINPLAQMGAPSVLFVNRPLAPLMEQTETWL
jgi:hypothetical protein